jgi:DNA-binding NarL/FixJ family response regulator
MDQPPGLWDAKPPPPGSFGSPRASSVLGPQQWAYLQRRYEMTPREVQIAQLVCQGLRSRRIAESLGIQPATVQVHVRNIYRKVKVRNKISMLLRFVDETR